jgi:MoxR-like ATPase
VLDRRIGEYRLPDGWRIVAAGNRENDRSVVYRMPDALSNRFVHLDFTPSFDDWRVWAIGRKLNPMVVAFLSLRRELLHKPGTAERAFPTPRSWEIAADILDAFDAGVGADDALAGTVGTGAAIELQKFIHSELSADEIEAVLAEPERAPLPTKVSSLYVLVSNIARRGREEAMRAIAGKLLARLPLEFATVLAKDILREHPPFVRNEHFKAFVTTHKEVFA